MKTRFFSIKLILFILAFCLIIILQPKAFAWLVSDFTANPGYIPADGNTITTATITIYNVETGEPVKQGGIAVTFGKYKPHGTLTPTSGTTNSNGQASTTFKSDVPEKVRIWCRYPDPNKGIGCWTEKDVDVYVVKVTFTPDPIDVGTDGIGVTTYSGESKNVTALIEPDDLVLNFGITDSSQASVSPTSGQGSVNLTVTSISDQDTSLYASAYIWILGSAPVKLHKPKRMEFYTVYDLPLDPGYLGDRERRVYKIYDYQDRYVDVFNYYNEETVTMVENDDGLGGSYLPVSPDSGSSSYSDITDTLEFVFTGTLEPGHKYKWNQSIKILGLSVENNLWKHDYRRIDATHLEIDSFSGQW